ncbi:MAG: response regulator [Alphaproteobacteria bacterium]|nr:response regulator [Alphaproteobacteria bacterium]
MKSIPLFFFPAEVILIDDDALILEDWFIKLSDLPISLKLFDNPFEALEYINNKILDQKDWSSLTPDHFRYQIYEPRRFQQISTIIVDYDMPGFTGLELCRKITSPHIQKIMLTGAASTSTAVDAFNERILDQFFQKSDLGLFSKLQNAIVTAQEQYFEKHTLALLHQCNLEFPESLILKDPVFMDFFKNTIQEKQVVEYYLLDATGSFLFLSDKGDASVLFMFNEEILSNQEDMIQEKDRHTDLAKEIYTHQKAICFYKFSADHDYEASEWKKYAYPLTKLEGKSTYLWAYVELPSLKSDQIVSFSQYRVDLETD